MHNIFNLHHRQALKKGQVDTNPFLRELNQPMKKAFNWDEIL